MLIIDHLCSFTRSWHTSLRPDCRPCRPNAKKVLNTRKSENTRKHEPKRMLETSRAAMWGQPLSPLNYSVHTETLRSMPRVSMANQSASTYPAMPVQGVPGSSQVGTQGVAGRVHRVVQVQVHQATSTQATVTSTQTKSPVPRPQYPRPKYPYPSWP